MAWVLETTDTTPELDDNLDVDLNAFELGAAVTVAGIGVASVGITTTLAPTVVGIPALFGGGLALAGYNKRHGHMPFMGDKEQAQAPAPKKAEAKAQVTDHGGNDVDIDGL